MATILNLHGSCANSCEKGDAWLPMNHSQSMAVATGMQDQCQLRLMVGITLIRLIVHFFSTNRACDSSFFTIDKSFH